MTIYFSAIFRRGEKLDFTHPEAIQDEPFGKHYDRIRAEFGARFADIVYKESPTATLRAVQDTIRILGDIH